MKVTTEFTGVKGWFERPGEIGKTEQSGGLRSTDADLMMPAVNKVQEGRRPHRTAVTERLLLITREATKDGDKTIPGGAVVIDVQEALRLADKQGKLNAQDLARVMKPLATGPDPFGAVLVSGKSKDDIFAITTDKQDGFFRIRTPAGKTFELDLAPELGAKKSTQQPAVIGDLVYVPISDPKLSQIRVVDISKVLDGTGGPELRLDKTLGPGSPEGLRLDQGAKPHAIKRSENGRYLICTSQNLPGLYRINVGDDGPEKVVPMGVGGKAVYRIAAVNNEGLVAATAHFSEEIHLWNIGADGKPAVDWKSIRDKRGELSGPDNQIEAVSFKGNRLEYSHEGNGGGSVWEKRGDAWQRVWELTSKDVPYWVEELGQGAVGFTFPKVGAFRIFDPSADSKTPLLDLPVGAGAKRFSAI